VHHPHALASSLSQWTFDSRPAEHLMKIKSPLRAPQSGATVRGAERCWAQIPKRASCTRETPASVQPVAGKSIAYNDAIFMRRGAPRRMGDS
ncbi:hypothetical protein M1O57_06020, partial [Dehalococcoidia bacterium]|nr:hypothetical protein [Dehalococcoidia bacterium]